MQKREAAFSSFMGLSGKSREVSDKKNNSNSLKLFWSDAFKAPLLHFTAQSWSLEMQIQAWYCITQEIAQVESTVNEQTG